MASVTKRELMRKAYDACEAARKEMSSRAELIAKHNDSMDRILDGILDRMQVNSSNRDAWVELSRIRDLVTGIANERFG